MSTACPAVSTGRSGFQNHTCAGPADADGRNNGLPARRARGRPRPVSTQRAQTLDPPSRQAEGCRCPGEPFPRWWTKESPRLSHFPLVRVAWPSPHGPAHAHTHTHSSRRTRVRCNARCQQNWQGLCEVSGAWSHTFSLSPRRGGPSVPRGHGPGTSVDSCFPWPPSGTRPLTHLRTGTPLSGGDT